MAGPGIFSGSMEAMVQPGEVRVRRALLSVSDKTGIVEFARGLSDLGVELSLGTRESLAAEAFSYTARYDSAISRWFIEKQDDFPPLLLTAFEKVTDLAYGENPHQRAAYYSQAGARMHVLSMVRQLGGKEVS